VRLGETLDVRLARGRKIVVDTALLLQGLVFKAKRGQQLKEEEIFSPFQVAPTLSYVSFFP